MVDSAAVGRHSTLQLAALGPNSAIFNSVFQLCSFLGVATTNLIAERSNAVQISTDDGASARLHSHEASSAFGTSLLLASALGIVSVALLKIHGGHWLAAMGTDPAVLPYAKEYLAIRALASPAVLIMNSCQGACLGKQDTLTPMMMFGAATFLNVVGDVYLVWNLGLGVTGAAIATVVAQYAAALFFLWRVFRKAAILPRWPGRSARNIFNAFLTVGATLVARTAVGMAAYFAMAVAANRLGPTAAAAHQVALQIFWFLSFFPEPLSMAAQTLIAKERRNPSVAKSWALLLVICGLLFGLVLAAVVAATFTFAPSMFTNDVGVEQAVKALAPYGAGAMAICGVMMMFDGVSIGASTFRHLPASVGAGMLATILVLYQNSLHHGGLFGVWWALIAFYAVRLLGHLVYYWGSRNDTVFASTSKTVEMHGMLPSVQGAPNN